MKTLQIDANFMLANGEFRSGVILACCAIEAARDRLLAEKKIKIGQLKVGSTDLVKHLSVGFESVFGASLCKDDPELFETLKSFWIARGEAAHGKIIHWRKRDTKQPIEEIEFGVLSGALAGILRWIISIEPKGRESFY